MQWRCPYTIVQKTVQMDYGVDIKGSIKALHANLWKKYIERDETICGILTLFDIFLIYFSDEDTEDS
jgi:hypothetical protein